MQFLVIDSPLKYPKNQCSVILFWSPNEDSLDLTISARCNKYPTKCSKIVKLSKGLSRCFFFWGGVGEGMMRVQWIMKFSIE